MTTLDLLTRPQLVDQAWEYFRTVQTKEQKYEPLIASTDRPVVSLNAKTMEQYRPEMRKYYYDPARYRTYLEQLGITYPTVRPIGDSGPTREMIYSSCARANEQPNYHATDGRLYASGRPMRSCRRRFP